MQDEKSLNLKSLGKEIKNYDFNYKNDYLENIERVFEKLPLIKIVAPEFTCLCPVTGQPDFATIKINYVPNKYMVESKSLKLYLFSFRNIGIFHEDVVEKILNDLINLLDPFYIEVIGHFNARGGISITPFANYAKPGTEYVDWVKYRKIKEMGNN